MVLVSIIMPAYNASSTIAESIKSVFDQTFTNWELIIVNDASTDIETQNIIDFYANQDSRIRPVLLQINSGMANARNLAISIAKGDYLAFLDSDDLWCPTKLEVQLNFHFQNPDVKISHTAFSVFNDSGEIKRPFSTISEIFIKKRGDLYPSILYKNPIGILTVLLHKNILDQIGLFDPENRGLEDHDLWIRVASKGYQFGFINKKLANYRISPNGIMRNLGRYKYQSKKFIKQYEFELKKSRLTNLTWAYFYSFFATEYFKKANYKLSILYFIKSIQLNKSIKIAVATFPYLSLACIKFLIQKAFD